MFTDDQYVEAYNAAHDADSARDRMLEAETAFERAQREFNIASRIASVVLGPTEKERFSKQEFIANPLGQFIRRETALVNQAHGPEASANIKLETWSKALDAKDKIAERFPAVDESEMHVVLIPKRKGTGHESALMYCADTGVQLVVKTWKDIMSKANIDLFTITLESGEKVDCRKAMTFRNYQSMIAQVTAISPDSEIDKYILTPWGSSKSIRLPWLTGEKSKADSIYFTGRSAMMGLVRPDGVVSYGLPSITSSHSFRPSVLLT